MSVPTTKIGFIGLGKMGSGICKNIQKTGAELIVFNRTKHKTRPFEVLGANVANSVKDLVQQSDLIFSSVLDDEAILDLCDGKNGILNNLTKDKIHVGLTTIRPDTADKLYKMHQERQTHYIAAPVIGRPDAAEQGEVISFLAGSKNILDTVLPFIRSYSKHEIWFSEKAGQANAMKICVNYMVMAQLGMLGEIFTFADKNHLDVNQVLAITQQFFAGNPTMSEYATKIANRNFEDAGFKLSAGLKDANIFDSVFTKAGVYPGAIIAAKENLMQANATGLSDKDWSALTEITRLKAN